MYWQYMDNTPVATTKRIVLKAESSPEKADSVLPTIISMFIKTPGTSNIADL